ncbi:Emopamil-binding protein [Phyllosticta capitalensis]|uniref:Emopamil-binding protein n=1 Tax=Phyllosticta capitalensis TaxID=121624 RepID=A0ABR1YUC3_9PEZI
MASAPAPSLLDPTTLLSLLGTVVALAAAYTLSLRLLPRTTSKTIRILFIWHVFDALIHAFFEGSFLYNCFFVSASRSSLSSSASPGSAAASPEIFEPLPPGVHWLGDPSRLYGAFYGAGPSSRLWQEYAKADRRWGGSDTGVVSLELLTVLIGAPLAAACAEGLRRGANASRKASGTFGCVSNKTWYWMTILATGELYGGWMTFCPEWLTGSPNLETGSWMYLWLYLSFFNLLWVAFPLWVMRLAYCAIGEGEGQGSREVEMDGGSGRARVKGE